MTEEEIKAICKKYKIKNYQINPDMSVDVNDCVVFSYENLSHLPLKLGIVTDRFYCSVNVLTSLEGCPRYVGKDFYCRMNNLTSLEYCPEYVGGDFDCTLNFNNRISIFHTYIGGNLYSDNLWKF